MVHMGYIWYIWDNEQNTHEDITRDRDSTNNVHGLRSGMIQPSMGPVPVNVSTFYCLPTRKQTGSQEFVDSFAQDMPSDGSILSFPGLSVVLKQIQEGQLKNCF